jgi:putative effector of murein hydrolase
MWRTIALLMLGILCTAVLCSVISVYLFHDVDQGYIDHLNAAFAELLTESVLFALIIGLPVWLLTALGRQTFRRSGAYPRARIGFFLGIAVTVFQYPLELAGRRLVPHLADMIVGLYLVAAVVLCTAILLRETFSVR